MVKNFFWTVMALVFSLFATAAPEQELSVAELVSLSLTRNPELRATELDANAAAAQAEYGGLWDDPVLELGFEQSHQPVNPPIGDTQFGRIGVSQAIPRPGRMTARRESFRALFRASDFDRELSRVELTAKVLRSIYRYKIASERWEHSRERVARIKTVDSFIRGRPFVAPQRQAEAMITKSKVALLEKQFRSFEADRVAAWNELKVYTGLENEPRLKVGWLKKSNVAASAKWYDKALASNPELRRRTFKLESQRAQANLERAESWQGVTLSGSYADGGGANPERNLGLGLTFPMPFVNANRAAIQSAEILVAAEQARVEWVKLQLKAAVDTSMQRLSAAAWSLERLPVESLASSEKEMAKIDQGFKKGQVELITYLEADAQHFENFNQSLESQIEYLSALSELYFMVGEAPPISEL